MFTDKKDLYPIKIELKNLIKKNNYEIKYLKTYLSSSIESLESKEDELKNKMYIDTQENPKDEHLLQALYENEIGKVSSYYYHSSIVLIYTFLENALYNICIDIQSNTGSKFSYKHLSGNNIIKKNKYYLEITTGMSFDKANKEWDRITQFQKLRNYIIHQNSIITDKEMIFKFKNMFPTIEVINENFFIKDHSLALEFLDTISEFLSFIYKNIKATSFLGKIVEGEILEDELPF